MAKLSPKAVAALDRLAVKIVSLVADRVTRDGELEAYDGIEAAREIRALMIRKFSQLKKSR